MLKGGDHALTGDIVSQKTLQPKPEACVAMARDRPNLASMFAPKSVAVIGAS